MSSDEAIDGHGPTDVAGRRPDQIATSQWFWDHYDGAALQIVEAASAVGLSLEGLDVVDVGCGDGSMALGLMAHARPRTVVGYDLNPVDVGHLERLCSAEGLSGTLPDGVAFDVSTPTRFPGDDQAFDFAYSWSAFEHIDDPPAVLAEIHRVLRPGALFFLQLWPFYASARGSHLWDWFPEPFHHVGRPETEVAEELRASTLKDEAWTQLMANEFEHLNKITLDELQRAVLSAGFSTVYVDLYSDAIVIPERLIQYSWADLALSGIKLIARRT